MKTTLRSARRLSVSTFTRAGVAALALSLCTAAHAAGDKLKIATVNMQSLFKEYYKTSQAQQVINTERARIQKDANERVTRLKELDQSLQSMKKQLDDPSISDAKKKATYQDFQMKQQEGQALETERRQFLESRNKALSEKMVANMKSILEEIQKVVEDRAKAEDYDYVFDKSGMSTSQVPFLLYTKDATDITPELVKILNKDAPADLEKPKDIDLPGADAGDGH